MTGILNHRLAVAIKFHDTLYWFRTVRGTSNTYIKDKLIQQHMKMREEVLYEVFLDLHKTYDALDHDLYLYILETYGVRPWSILLLRRYWDRITMVEPAGGYYGALFKGFCGVTQRDPLSTTISTWL